MNFIYFIPIATFCVSIIFSYVLYKHYRAKPDATYILWWLIGVVTYGAGTLTESINTVFGWSELNFRLWYITGALLGGAPLAQGTVYLLMKRKTANILSAVLVAAVLVSSIAVMFSPIDHGQVVAHRMSGKVFTWQWVRAFSPFINLYALVFLVGGAIYSAIAYYKNSGLNRRFWGNLLIAVGAILPGIGGSFTRMGYVEVLYVTEFIGLCFIIMAYRMMRSDGSSSVHTVQVRQALT